MQYCILVLVLIFCGCQKNNDVVPELKIKNEPKLKLADASVIVPIDKYSGRIGAHHNPWFEITEKGETIVALYCKEFDESRKGEYGFIWCKTFDRVELKNGIKVKRIRRSHEN